MLPCRTSVVCSAAVLECTQAMRRVFHLHERSLHMKRGITMNTLHADDARVVETARVQSTEHRRAFRQLYRRYQYLSRCTSAADQRERSTLQAPLLELFHMLHPATVCVHFEDDFDVVMRSQRRS
jgi:hypothetical protein